MADNENDNNVISLFEAKTPILTEMPGAGAVGMTGTTGPTGCSGGWHSPPDIDLLKLFQKSPFAKWSTNTFLTDPISEMFAGLDIKIFDQMKNLTESASKSVADLHKSLQPYSGDLETFFNNVQKFREQCNSLISFPPIYEVPRKQGELDNVRFLCHQKDVLELAISGIPKQQVQPRLMCRKAYYLIKIKANVAKGHEINTRISIDLKEFMDGLGKKIEDKNKLKVEKNRTKTALTKAIQRLDTNAIIHCRKGKLEIVLSQEFLKQFIDQQTHTYIPWLLEINSEYTFRVAEKLIAHYSNLNNSQKTRPNYHRLSYNKIFREIFGDPKKVNAQTRYDGYDHIKNAISLLIDAGFIEGSWHKGNTDLKNKKPDNHEEAMDCILEYHIPKFDSYKLSINRPLPHQLG